MFPISRISRATGFAVLGAVAVVLAGCSSGSIYQPTSDQTAMVYDTPDTPPAGCTLDHTARDCRGGAE